MILLRGFERWYFMSVGNDKIRILVTIPKEIKPQLELAALMENRSVSNYVSVLIQKELEKQHKDSFINLPSKEE